MRNLKRIALFILAVLSLVEVNSQQTTMIVTGFEVPVYKKANQESEIVYWLKFGEEFLTDHYKTIEQTPKDLKGNYYLGVLTKELNKGYIKKDLSSIAPLIKYGIRGYSIPSGLSYCIVKENEELNIRKSNFTLGEDYGDGRDILSDITNCGLTLISQMKLQEGRIEGTFLTSEENLFNPGYYKKIYEKNDTSYYLSTEGCYAGGGVYPPNSINAEVYITRERKWRTSLLEHQEIKRTNLSMFLPSSVNEKGSAVFIGDIDHDGLLELFISSNRGYTRTVFTERESGEFELK